MASRQAAHPFYPYPFPAVKSCRAPLNYCGSFVVRHIVVGSRPTSWMERFVGWVGWEKDNDTARSVAMAQGP